MSTLKSTGFASCVGGYRPDPPIDGFPLLVCVDGVIKTEDGAVTVADVVDAFHRINTTIAERAYRHRTTEAHIRQAFAYAIIAGLIDP